MTTKGTFRRRGKSSYQLRATVDGRRAETTVHARNDAEANVRLAEWLFTFGQAPASDAQTMTVAELAEHYWAIEGGRLARSTRAAYRRKIDNYIVPDLGKFAVGDVTPVMLRRWFADIANGTRSLDGRPQKASTFGNLRAPLSRMFALAVEMQLIVQNPVDPVRRPHVDQTDPTARALTGAQFWTLIEQTRAVNPELAAALWTTVAIGARRSELCALRWGDVDLAAGNVTISGRITADETGTWAEERTTKGRKPRTVTIDPDTADMLHTHRKAMVERALACGVGLEPNGYVFSDAPDGATFWHPNAFSSRWLKVAERAGLRDQATRTRFHDLRHTFVTWLADHDVRPHDIQTAAGHQSYTVTERYIHARQANPAIGQAIGRAFRQET